MHFANYWVCFYAKVKVNKMKDKAIEYLMKNPLFHMGMIEAINRNSADILYADADGVLIREQKGDAYMLSVESLKKGVEILHTISECDIIVVHQQFMCEYVLNKFGLHDTLECLQAVYLRDNKLEVTNDIEIRQLDLNQIDVIIEHYHRLSKNDIEVLLSNGDIFGGYRDDTLIGFIGIHLEGSIGLLEIFPEYRSLGYGTILESFMVNKMLDDGFVPYAHIEFNNSNSLGLQKKLGFQISPDRLYWLY